MDILHARGEATAAEVLEALPSPPSYSAVRALLKILEDKDHATHREHEGRYVYRPKTSRRRASRSALQRVVTTFFEGSVTATIAALLDSGETDLPESEAQRLRAIIDQARKEGR